MVPEILIRVSPNLTEILESWILKGTSRSTVLNFKNPWSRGLGAI